MINGREESDFWNIQEEKKFLSFISNISFLTDI